MESLYEGGDMRFAIFWGLICIAEAIAVSAEKPYADTPVRNFLVAVAVLLFLMDFADFIRSMF